MRAKIALTFLFSTSIAFAAAPKDLGAMMKESQEARATATKETSPAKKTEALKGFEKSLNATIKDYEKANPTVGTDAEEKVVKFSYRFEPVFALAAKKISASECTKTREQIEKEDLGNKPEGTALTANAQEALLWVDILCK